MLRPNRFHPLHQSIATALRAGLCATALCLSVSTAALAQDTSGIAFDIPAQPMSEALRTFAEQAGMQLLYRPDAITGLNARALQGQYDRRQALEQLLRETDLEVVYSADNVATIRVKGGSGAQVDSGLPAGGVAAGADVKALDTVKVFASMSNQVAIGSKSGQTLRETPKSVTLVTRERLEAQNLISLEDAMKQTTGVTVAGYGSGESWYFSRGIRVQTVLKDGGAAGLTGSFGGYLTPDMSAYEQLEVLRGVDGMFTGAGEPGGVINLVRKRAKAKKAVQVNLTAGRWDFYRGEVDVTGPLSSDGRLRGRAVAAMQDSGYFYQRAKSDRKTLFGTLEYDLTPSTLLITGASYERRKEDGYSPQGTGRYTDGRALDLPRHWAYNPDWSHWYFTTKEAFLRVDQQYGETGLLKVNLTRTDQESVSRTVTPYGEVNPVTGAGMFAGGWATDNFNTQTLLDVSANGHFPLFGREHRYTVGADYAKIDGDGSSLSRLDGYAWGINNGRPINPWDFDPADYPEPAAIMTRYSPDNRQAQSGFYATVGLTLAEPLKLTLGGRYGKFRQRTANQVVTLDVQGNYVFGAPVVTAYSDSAFIPSAALTWDFAKDWTAYASYAETFKVQANRLQAPLPGTPLDPVTGASMEIGIKGEVMGFLNVSAAAFRLERSGQASRDPSYPNTPGEMGAICCFFPQSDMTTQGVDLEVSGEVLPGWQVFGGYTYSTSEFASDADWVYYIHMTPKHMLKLWSTWQLPGRWSRWTLNGGVVTQSETYMVPFPTANSTFTYGYRFGQSGYALWNAALQYRVSDTWNVGVYIENLTDKHYYQAFGLGGRTETVYGTPRNVTLSLRGRW